MNELQRSESPRRLSIRSQDKTEEFILMSEKKIKTGEDIGGVDVKNIKLNELNPTTEGNTEVKTKKNKKLKTKTKYYLLYAFIGIIVILGIIFLILSQIYCFWCPPESGEVLLRAIKDPAFEEIKVNLSKDEQEMMKEPPSEQALSDKTKQILRWYPLYEICIYRLKINKKGDFNSVYLNANVTEIKETHNETVKNISEKREKENEDKKAEQLDNSTIYTISFITIDSKGNAIVLYVLIKEGNEPYNLTNILLNSTESNDSTSASNINNGNAENVEINNETNTKNYKLQINLINCSALRTGKVVSCLKPVNINETYFMIAMNALDQFLPILNKTYINIFKVTNGRLLSENELVQGNKEKDEVKGVYGSDYEKEHNLIVKKGDKDNTNSSIQMQSSYKQNELGGEMSLESEKDEFKVKKTTDMNNKTTIPEKSHSEGSLNVTSKKNISIEGTQLNKSDYLCESMWGTFTVEMILISEPKILPFEEINLIKNLSLLIEFEEILNPIENNTIYKNQFDNSSLQNNSKRLLEQYGNQLFQHREYLFRTNVIGINVYGYIDVFCYDQDVCVVFGTINIGGIFKLDIFEKTIRDVKIAKAVEKYKVIQWKSLEVINSLNNLLNNTVKELKGNHSEYEGTFKESINIFEDTINQSIFKYSNILDEISKKFNDLDGFILDIIEILKDKFYYLLNNLINYIEDKSSHFYFIYENIEKTILSFQCGISKNQSLIEKAITLIPMIKQNFKSFYKNQMDEFNSLYLNNIIMKLLENFWKVFNSQINKLPNEDVRTMISKFITDKINSTFKNWNSILEIEYINSKIKLNVGFVKNEEKLNTTLKNYKNFLEETKNISCSKDYSENDLNILLDETEILNFFDYSYSIINRKLTFYPIEVDNVIKLILSNGIMNLDHAIKSIIIDSKNTFKDIMYFVDQKLTNSSSFISDKISKFAGNFKNYISSIYDTISFNAKEAFKLFSDVFNKDYKIDDEDLKKMDPNIFNIPKVIDNIFDKFKLIKKNFDDLLDFLKNNLYPSRRRRLLNSDKQEKRILNQKDLFKQFFDKIKDKFQSLVLNYDSSKITILKLSSSFGISLDLLQDDFNPYKDNLISIFHNEEINFIDITKNILILGGKKLSLDSLIDIHSLKDILINTLKSLLPSTEIEIYKHENKYEKQFALLKIPIVIGTANVDALFEMKSNLLIVYGINSEGNIYLKIIPGAGIYLGLTAYLEIVIIRLGMYVKMSLFEGTLNLYLGFNFFNFKFNLKLTLDLDVLKMTIGSYMQLFLPTFKWFCFKINLFFFKIKICLPFIWFEWTKWIKLFEISIQFFPRISLLILDKYVP